MHVLLHELSCLEVNYKMTFEGFCEITG